VAVGELNDGWCDGGLRELCPLQQEERIVCRNSAALSGDPAAALIYVCAAVVLCGRSLICNCLVSACRRELCGCMGPSLDAEPFAHDEVTGHHPARVWVN
jgi:hypothetical protein